jgi:hypothetical protein
MKNHPLAFAVVHNAPRIALIRQASFQAEVRVLYTRSANALDLALLLAAPISAFKCEDW